MQTCLRAVRRLGFLMLLAQTSCPDKSDDFPVRKNSCLTNFDCERDTVCNEGQRECVREDVISPYQVVLQVRGRVADVPLVEQQTFPPFTLQGAKSEQTLEVPLSVVARGSVLRRSGNALLPVESEVTFEPVPNRTGNNAPVTSTVVNTRGKSGNFSGTASPQNLSVRLNPNTRYRVRVQPLVEDSRILPPTSAEYETSDADADNVAIEYPEMQRRAGTLRNESGRLLTGHLIRLEDKISGVVVSSTTQVAADGTFELFAPEDVMTGQGFDVVISPPTFARWRVKVAIDASLLVDGSDLVVPDLPAAVGYTGDVDAEETDREGNALAVPYADMTFVSTFPVEVQARDWCRFRLAADRKPAPKCSARVTTTADQDGKFSTSLLPGPYQIFVTPSSSRNEPLGVGARRVSERIESRPDDAPQTGRVITLGRPATFMGLVMSGRGETMPNVSVTARSLSLPGPTPETEVYQFGRSVTASSDEQGRFRINVDLGYYDLSVEPPNDSGFAWLLQLNRQVSEAGEVKLAPLEPRVPIVVSGNVKHAVVPTEEAPSDDATLPSDDVMSTPVDTSVPNAIIEAFTFVRGIDGGERAVRVGQTTSDASGAFRLLLPPELGPDEAIAPRN